MMNDFLRNFGMGGKGGSGNGAQAPGQNGGPSGAHAGIGESSGDPAAGFADEAAPGIAAAAQRSQRLRKGAFETESLGGFHEALRLKCENVAFKFSELNSTMGAVDDLFREFAKISEDLQSQVSLNLELGRENARMRAEHDALHERVAALDFERSEAEQRLRRVEASVDSHRAEARRAAELVAQLEGRAEEAAAEANGLRRELITIQPLYADLNEETVRLRQRMDETAHELASARASADALELRLIAESETLESERKALRELNMRYLEARQQLSDSEQAQARMRTTIEQLQAEVARLKELDRELRLMAEEERTKRETDAAAHEAKLYAIRSRSELVERLLEKAREELRTHVDATRRADQIASRLAQSEEALTATRAELVRTKDETMSLQAAKDSLTMRADELARKLSEQDDEIQRITAEKLDQRRDMEFAIAAQQKDAQKLQAQIRSLEDQLMKEKSERAYAEGALDTARRDRLQLQRLANELKRDEMLALVSPGEQQETNEPTALRRP
jgi:crescentin